MTARPPRTRGDRPARIGPGRRLSAAARREHLVEAALEVFARQRYEETELEDVASVAAVRRSLLYHYFPGGKEDLYVAALEHAWAQLVGRLAVAPTRGAGDPLPANLAAYLDLVEADDPAVAVVRQARRLEGPRIEAVTRAASSALARGMAANHLGAGVLPAPVLAAFLGFLGFFEVVLDQWTTGAITRGQLEALVTDALPALAEAAARAGEAG